MLLSKEDLKPVLKIDEYGMYHLTIFIPADKAPTILTKSRELFKKYIFDSEKDKWTAFMYGADNADFSVIVNGEDSQIYITGQVSPEKGELDYTRYPTHLSIEDTQNIVHLVKKLIS